MSPRILIPIYGLHIPRTYSNKTTDPCVLQLEHSNMSPTRLLIQVSYVYRALKHVPNETIHRCRALAQTYLMHANDTILILAGYRALIPFCNETTNPACLRDAPKHISIVKLLTPVCCRAPIVS